MIPELIAGPPEANLLSYANPNQSLFLWKPMLACDMSMVDIIWQFDVAKKKIALIYSQ